MKICLLFCIVLCQTLAWCDESDLNSILHGIRNDVAVSINEINAQRQSIETEKSNLLQKIESLEARNGQLFHQIQEIKNLEQQRDKSQQSLQDEVTVQRQTLDHLHNSALDFRRSFEMTMSCLDSVDFAKSLEMTDNQLAAVSDEDWLNGYRNLLAESLKFCQKRASLEKRPGSAVGANGLETTGQFVLAGPAVYFSNGNDLHGPILYHGLNMPQLFEGISDESKSAVQSYFLGQEAPLPMDVSGEKAMRIETTRKNFKETLIAGGVVMVPIILIGAVGLIMIVLKFISLSQIKTDHDLVLQETLNAIKSGQPETASKKLIEKNDLFSSILLEGVNNSHQPVELVEELMFDKMTLILPKLEKHLGLLAVFAAVAPLLGLLGTVTGMIQTFQTMTLYGSGEPTLLSGGISEALITTAGGLIVAIPIMLCHALLNRKVKKIVQGWQRCVMVYVNQLNLKSS